VSLHDDIVRALVRLCQPREITAVGAPVVTFNNVRPTYDVRPTTDRRVSAPFDRLISLKCGAPETAHGARSKAGAGHRVLDSPDSRARSYYLPASTRRCRSPAARLASH